MGKKLLVVLAVIAAATAFLVLDVGSYLSLDTFRARRAELDTLVQRAPLIAGAVFFLTYVAVTALSIPGAAVMTLIGGALFGLSWGVVLVSFASALGATLAFLASRFLLRDSVQSRFGDKLAAINAGIRRDGAFYLFALRLVPAFPFFAVNLAMGVTAIPVWTYYWVSQLGMLAGTIAYVYAGTQLTELRLTWQLAAAFTLLGVFPLLAKRVVEAAKARRAYARWKRPRRFDRNLVVIGAGSAGLVAAYIAAAVRAKVTLIEQHRMGGDCLNTGCVPSKALVRTTSLLAQIRRAEEYGLGSADPEVRFDKVMDRVRRVIRSIEPHDSVERYTALGVECVRGRARITSPWTVEADIEDGSTRTFATRNIVIAAGARPFVPAIPGLDAVQPLTSDTVWDLTELPRRLVVLGGGPVGCELAQCFARLGSRVTQVQRAPRLLVREDPEAAELVSQRFRAEGIEVLTGHTARRVVVEDGERFLVVEREGGSSRIPFDRIICAVGRVANTEGYGLETLGIPRSAAGTIQTDEYLRTLYPNIYACGDVAGPFQFTHTAAHQAWYAAVNALFGGIRKSRADYRVIPWATFTQPEVARVGLNESEAREKNVAHEVTRYALSELDRALTDEEAYGFVKVITQRGSDRILGATIVGAHAGELIAEFVLAMKHKIGLSKILGTIHVYPTFAEANKHAAGVWKRNHAPPRVLAWLERYHAWTRG